MKNSFRKAMAVMLCIALIFSLAQSSIAPVLPVEASAEDISVVDSGKCGAKLEWVLYDDGRLCISGTGDMYSYKPGSDFNAPWYSHKAQVKSVEIAQGAASIGASAFFGCTALESVEIPGSVLYIGNVDTDDTAFRGVFQDCIALDEITIPSTVEGIGKNAFLNSAVYNDETKWSDNALYIDNCLIAVKSTFSGTYQVKKGTRLIAGGAFERCAYLSEIIIPDGVTDIGCKAFNSCDSLKTVTIPGTVSHIGYMAFSNCNIVERLNYTGTLSQWVGTVMDYYTSNPLFYGKGALYINGRELTDITANDLKGVKSIEAYAFYGCKGLARASFPDSLEHIGEKAFFNTRIYNMPSEWEDGVLYIGSCLITAENLASSSCSVKTGTKVIADGAFNACAGVSQLHIPYGVTDIGKNAFKKCISITSLYIPDSVMTIGESAFDNCRNLKEITLPSYIRKIENNTFNYCSSLSVITIPDGVTDIEDYAFYNSAIRSVYLPLSVKSIGAFAFYCGSLRDVYYAGNEDDKSDIDIAGYNQYLDNAVWHYETAPEIHTHDYSVTYEWSEDNLTCTATAVCKDDSQHTVTEAVATDAKIITPSSCTVSGETEYTATFRMALFTAQTKTVENKTAPGHTAVTDKAVPATCSKEGLTQGSHCSVCGEILTQQKTVERLPHTVVTGKAVAPTCTSSGVTAVKRCSVCGEIIEPRRTVPATGHTDKDDNGFCDVCNAVINSAKAYPCGNVVIKTAEAKRVDVRTRLTIQAQALNVPSGYYLAIYMGNSRVAEAISKGEKTTTVSYYAGEIKGDIEYSVKIISADGSVQKDSFGRDLSAKAGKITCDKGIFKVIAAFFKGLFNSLPSMTIKP